MKNNLARVFRAGFGKMYFEQLVGRSFKIVLEGCHLLVSFRFRHFEEERIFRRRFLIESKKYASPVGKITFGEFHELVRTCRKGDFEMIQSKMDDTIRRFHYVRNVRGWSHFSFFNYGGHLSYVFRRIQCERLFQFVRSYHSGLQWRGDKVAA